MGTARKMLDIGRAHMGKKLLGALLLCFIFSFFFILFFSRFYYIIGTFDVRWLVLNVMKKL